MTSLHTLINRGAIRLSREALTERREVDNCQGIDHLLIDHAQSREEIAKDQKATSFNCPSMNVPAQSREEIVQDRNVAQNATIGTKPLSHPKSVEDEWVEHIHEKDKFFDLKPAPFRRIYFAGNFVCRLAKVPLTE